MKYFNQLGFFVLLNSNLHCVKSVGIRTFSGRYFRTFGLSAERYGISLCIQSECEDIRTRKAPNMDIILAVFFIRFLLN